MLPGGGGHNVPPCSYVASKGRNAVPPGPIGLFLLFLLFLPTKGIEKKYIPPLAYIPLTGSFSAFCAKWGGTVGPVGTTQCFCGVQCSPVGS